MSDPLRIAFEYTALLGGLTVPRRPERPAGRIVPREAVPLAL